MRRLRSLGEKNRDVPLISMGGQMDDFFARLQKRTRDGTKLPTWCVITAFRSDEPFWLIPIMNCSGTESSTLSCTAVRTRRTRQSRRATARSKSPLRSPSPSPFPLVFAVAADGTSCSLSSTLANIFSRISSTLQLWPRSSATRRTSIPRRILTGAGSSCYCANFMTHSQVRHRSSHLSLDSS